MSYNMAKKSLFVKSGEIGCTPPIREVVPTYFTLSLKDLFLKRMICNDMFDVIRFYCDFQLLFENTIVTIAFLT